jgi:predicted esterase
MIRRAQTIAVVIAAAPAIALAAAGGALRLGIPVAPEAADASTPAPAPPPRPTTAAPASGAPAPVAVGPDVALGRLRDAALASLARARKTAVGDIAREISLPSIERLVEDADLRRASITVPDRDWGFVRSNLETARAFADRLAAGDDPYRTATGMLIKAYRADWDATLQPYALAVPARYQAGKAKWPLVVALHGAYSDHRHNLRRVFGLDNRRGETDAEASRNELPLPEVGAIVVSPFGRGELMGYDGLGRDDVMRVLADVRRAYDVDPERITLTGLSMGGEGTWQIGLRHPELFAAIAPVCGVTDTRRLVRGPDAALYDLAALEALSPLALAENAARMPVMIFHGSDDPTVPVGDSRRMVERYRALGWLGKNVHYTEYPNVGHDAWRPAYKDASLLRALAAIKRRPGAPRKPVPPPPPGQAVPGLFGKSVPRQGPHLYVYGSKGAPGAVAAARLLATRLADWGPMTSAKFAVKADHELTTADRMRFDLVLVGAAPLNSLTADVALPELATAGALGDRAFRALVPDPMRQGRFVLVLGALTPRGFDRLQRFAHANSDAWAPEPNRPFALLAD